MRVIEEGKAYVYSEEKRLWEYQERTEIFDCICPILDKTIKECIKKVSNNDNTIAKQQYKALAKTKKMIQTTSFIKNVVNRFGKYFKDKDFENKLNIKHTLLPIRNGKVIDMVTGEIKDRIREDYFTWESIVQDTSTVSSKDIDTFYQGLANNDNDLAIYLKQISLYFMTGLTFDRGFYQLIGVGKNGKSLFINVLRNILRESAINGSRDLIIRNSKNPSRNEGASPHLLATKGKRLLTFTETESGDKLHASKVKLLTGGDITEARQMYCTKIEEFYMSGKILIASNALLEFYDSDQATKDRTRILPFNNRFEQNDNYQKYVTSKEFLSALVIHLVKNYSSCLKNQHIDLPKSVTEENEELFDNLDIFAQWVSECIVSSTGENTKATYLYNSYLQYAQLNNINDIMSQCAFGRKMKSAGYVKVKKGTMQYENITIRDQQRFVC
jgi:putative DNA primase/helicase